MIKLVKDIKEANCITHSGTMHADDVFSTAFLELYLGNINVIRVSDINAEDFSDVLVYDVGRGVFDHHQEDARVRENGIKYAAFGLLWDKYGKDYLEKNNISNVDEVFLEIDKNLVEGIDAIDNGVFPKIEANYRVKTVSDVIKLFNPSFGSDEDLDEQFLKAVSVAKMIFSEEVLNSSGKVIAKYEILKKIDGVTNHLLILDEYMPYEETLLKSMRDDIYFSIYPSNRGGYAIKTIPISSEDRTSRVSFPSEWGGLVGADLEKISGEVGASFCHANLFLATCNSLEVAINLANKAISLSNNDVKSDEI